MNAYLKNNRTTITGIVAVCLLVTGLYYPGLGGPFLFDDYHNLSRLENIEQWDTGYFVYSGISSFLGRPLVLLTFALQHQSWPQDPFAFKLVNLLIHLGNGLLVFLIAYLLAKSRSCAPRLAAGLGLTIMAVWLLHPIHISTVLYTVQRMTLLSGFFTLTGILGYLFFRQQLLPGHQAGQRRIFVAMGLCVSLSMILAILCKENGILLPLYILVLDWTLLRDLPSPRELKYWSIAMLYLPLVILIIYLVSIFDVTTMTYLTRDFSMGQRLLTELNVVTDYILNIIVPRPGAFAFYYDDYPVATGLTSPPRTLISLLLIAGLLIAASCMRRAKVIISFSILWFFAGHSLESTYLPLELYFEHRNYLPSLGIITLVAYGFMSALDNFRDKTAIKTLAVIYLVLISSITFANTRLWRDNLVMSTEWVREHPTSLRALQSLNRAYLERGEFDKAGEVYDKLQILFPENLYIALYDITVKGCLQEQELTDEDWQPVLTVASQSRTFKGTSLSEVDSIISNMVSGKCNRINPYNLINLLIVLKQNNHYQNKQDEIHELLSLLALIVGDADAAMANVNRSISLAPTPPRYVLKFSILMQQGKIDEARQVLGLLKNMKTEKPHEILAYRKVIERLEMALGQ